METGWLGRAGLAGRNYHLAMAHLRLVLRLSSARILLRVAGAETGFPSPQCSRFARSSVLQRYQSSLSHSTPAISGLDLNSTQEPSKVLDVGKPSVHETPVETKEEFPFPLKRIQFRTCDHLYKTYFVEHGAKVPLAGLQIDCGYIDTGFPEDRGEPADGNVVNGKRVAFPTVLCIHGAAGTHKDLEGVIKSLAKKGARVVCPNFPGFGHTPMDEHMAFKHTLIEHCNFLLDFLRNLNIRRVDLMVGFSCGCYPAVPLATKTGFPVRGLALIQVPGHRPYRGVRPFWVLRNVVKIMDNKWIRNVLNPISYLIMKVTGWNHIPTINHPYIMGLVTTGVPFESYQRVSAEMPFSRLPLLMTFSEDDQFVEAAVSYEYAHLVGLPKERLTYLDPEGNIVRRGAPRMDPDHYLKGLVFQKGGHYAQRKQPSGRIIEESVGEIFEHICRDNARRREEMQAYSQMEDQTSHARK